MRTTVTGDRRRSAARFESEETQASYFTSKAPSGFSMLRLMEAARRPRAPKIAVLCIRGIAAYRKTVLERDVVIHVIKAARGLRRGGSRRPSRSLSVSHLRKGSRRFFTCCHLLKQRPQLPQPTKIQGFWPDAPGPLIREIRVAPPPHPTVLANELPKYLLFVRKQLWKRKRQHGKPISLVNVPQFLSLTHEGGFPVVALSDDKPGEGIFNGPFDEARQSTPLLPRSQFCEIAQFGIEADGCDLRARQAAPAL